MQALGGSAGGSRVALGRVGRIRIQKAGLKAEADRSDEGRDIIVSSAGD